MKKTALDVKLSNRLLVYRLLMKRGELSRVDISRETGISAPTVLKIMQYFLDFGIVEQIGIMDTKLGRKPSVFQFRPDFARMIAIYIEGRYAKIGVVNAIGQILELSEQEVKAKTVADLFSEIEGFIEGIYGGKYLGIGIALPATIDPEKNLLYFAPFIGVYEETDIKVYLDKLTERYGCRVFVENDVKALALAEHRGLQLYDEFDLGAISLGTGVGLGLIMSSSLLRGSQNALGEIGYMCFDVNATASQGEIGWLEQKIGLDSLKQNFGFDFKKPETFTAAVRSHLAAYLALAITNVVLITNVDLISLGGVIAEVFDEGFLNELRIRVQNQCILRVKIQKASFSPLGGLAHLVIDQSDKKILLKDEV